MFRKKKFKTKAVKEKYEFWCGFTYELVHVKGFLTGPSFILDSHIKSYHRNVNKYDKEGLWITPHAVCLEYKKYKKLDKEPSENINFKDIEDFELVD